VKSRGFIEKCWVVCIGKEFVNKVKTADGACKKSGEDRVICIFRHNRMEGGIQIRAHSR
jgi:hypothetical protein